MPDTPATLEAVSDEALARRIADGRPGSTDAEEAELYRRFAPRVRLYGRRHLQNDAASRRSRTGGPAAHDRAAARR